MPKHLTLADGSFHILEESHGPKVIYEDFENLIRDFMGDEAASYFKEIIKQKEADIEEARSEAEYDNICADAFHKLEHIHRKITPELTSGNINANLSAIENFRDTIKRYRRILNAL